MKRGDHAAPQVPVPPAPGPHGPSAAADALGHIATLARQPALSLDEFFSRSLDALDPVVGSAAAAVLTVEKGPAALTVRAARSGWAVLTEGAGLDARETPWLELSGEQSDTLWDSGAALEAAARPLDERSGFTSSWLLCAPLPAEGALGGVLVLGGAPGAAPPSAGRRAWVRAAALQMGAVVEVSRLRAALAQARKREQGLDAARRHLVTLASHELLTPITLVQAHADLLAAQAADRASSDDDGALTGLRRGLDRLLAVAHDLLTLESLDRGEVALRLGPVDVEELVTELADEMLPLARRRGLRLLAEPPADPEVILADPERLRAVLGQLVLNALRFTPDRGTVVVGGESASGGVTLWVSDTGIGIPPEQHERIFERLVELGPIEHHHSGDADFRGGGLGLGLAVARAVVEAHGGKIWVESEVGRGSDFYLRLPRGGPDG